MSEVQMINHEGLINLALRAYAIKRALFVQGPPGIGKSYTIVDASNLLAEQLGLDGVAIWPECDVKKFNLVDIRLSQLDAVDIRGLPVTTNNALTWLPPDFLALSPEIKGFYFFDEINLAPPLIQAAAYSIVYDRRAGNMKLPEGMGIIAAGNRMEDRAAIYEMASPLINRFLRCELRVPTEEEWTNWAMHRGLDSRVIGFIKQNPSFLYKAEEDGFPIRPRSWEFCSDSILGIDSPEQVSFLTPSSIGPAGAAQFAAFAKLVRNIDIDAIMADPKKGKLPTAIDEVYALVSAISERFRNKADDKAVLKTVMMIAKILPPEFGILLMRMTKPLLAATIKSQFRKLLQDVGLTKKFGRYFD